MRWILLILLSLPTTGCSLDELLNNSEETEKADPVTPNVSDPVPCDEDQFVSNFSLPESDDLGLTDGFFFYSEKESSLFLGSRRTIYKKERNKTWTTLYEHPKETGSNRSISDGFLDDEKGRIYFIATPDIVELDIQTLSATNLATSGFGFPCRSLGTSCEVIECNFLSFDPSSKTLYAACERRLLSKRSNEPWQEISIPSEVTFISDIYGFSRSGIPEVCIHGRLGIFCHVNGGAWYRVNDREGINTQQIQVHRFFFDPSSDSLCLAYESDDGSTRTCGLLRSVNKGDWENVVSLEGNCIRDFIQHKNVLYLVGDQNCSLHVYKDNALSLKGSLGNDMRIPLSGYYLCPVNLTLDNETGTLYTPLYKNICGEIDGLCLDIDKMVGVCIEESE